MNAVPEPNPDEALAQALAQAPACAERLAHCLAQEFEALKQRDLAAFEALQADKNAALAQLDSLAQRCKRVQPVPLAWQNLRESLVQSREHHLRNLQLLQRQLQGVRGALQALQGQSAAPVDLYDRSGQVARGYAAWRHHLA